MSQSAVENALDLASFSNITDQAAFEAVSAAMLGEFEMLKSRTGIVINDAVLTAQLAAIGVRKEAATSAQRAAAVQAIMERAMQRQGSSGDATRTRNSTANLARASDGQRVDALAEAGAKLATFDREVQIIKGRAAGIFLEMGDNAQTAVIGIGLLSSVLGPLATVYQLIAAAKIRDSMATIAGTTATGTNTAATTANTTSRLGNLVAAARAVAVWAANTTVMAIQTAALWANTLAQRAWAIGSALLSGALVPATAAMWAFTAALLANPITWIVAAVLALCAAVYLIYQNWGPISSWFEQLWGKIQAAVATGWQWIMDKFNAGIAWLAALPGRFNAMGLAIMQGIVNGIASGAGWVRDKIYEIAGNIGAWFADTLGIHSPSRVFAGFGGNLSDGLIEGLNRSMPGVRRAVDALSLVASPRLSMAQVAAKGTFGIPRARAIAGNTDNRTYSSGGNNIFVNGARNVQEVGREVGRALDRRERSIKASAT